MTQRVTEKIAEYFSAADSEEAAAALDSNDINEPRVQLAIIKLSGGQLEKLKNLIEVAKIDWRDVLAWAEYPTEFAAATWNLKEDEVAEIRGRDREQYQRWIQGNQKT